MKYNYKISTKGAFIIFLAIMLVITTASTLPKAADGGGYQSPTSQFSIGEVNFTVYAIAPLQWDGNAITNITVFINATSIPQGTNLTIVSISFYYQKPNKPNREFADTKVVNTNITSVNRTLNAIHGLSPPSDTNEFNITIDIIAHTDTISDQTFTTEFPGDYPYISVKRENVLPIINLPGFPNIESFSRWIIMFILIAIILSLPSIFVGIRKLSDIIAINKKKKRN